MIIRFKIISVLIIGLTISGNQSLAANMSLYAGNEGLTNLTSGDGNVAIGDQTLADTTSGSSNTAVGNLSLYSNKSGSENTAIGAGALASNIEGSNNTVIGSQAGSNNVVGTGNVFIGYMAGSQSTGSNMLVIANSSDTTPLIYGDFAQDSVTINGDFTVSGGLNVNSMGMDEVVSTTGQQILYYEPIAGTVHATIDEIISTTGQKLMHFEPTTGAIHLGQNSMVFYDSAGAVGNGKDIMASSVGKIQIGQNPTDVTSFVGEVSVPEPTKPDHAATKRYTDNTAAMSVAMASAVNPSGDGHHVGLGFGSFGDQNAVALGLSIDLEHTIFSFSASQSDAMESPAYSGGFSWSF